MLCGSATASWNGLPKKVRSPSGEQYELAFEDHAAVVTEVGAGLRSYAVRERLILDGYGADEICPSGRGQVLMPWPNRIANGSYEFAGRGHQLPINELSTGSAIHGLVRWVGWNLVDRDDRAVVLEHHLHPQPGYPFALALRIEYTLSADGLRAHTSATNVGDEPCPFGAGAHPYLLPGTPTIDDATLSLPARSVLTADARGAPAGSSAVKGTPLDFMRARPIGDAKVDACFTDLERDREGLVRVGLTRPENGIGVTLWADESYPYLMLYSGDDRPDVARRSVAVEPMTCPPNAFSSGEDVIVLEPGASFSGAWGLEPS
jgi:aldose 1-epimerase